MKKITIKNFTLKKKLGGISLGLSLVLALFISALASAQVTLIDASGDGGFETGTTLAANGWTAINAPNGNRSWYIGTAQAGYTGARAAFIGNNNTTIGTATGARTVHLYRSITIPAGAEDIQLTFKYKQAVAHYVAPNYLDYIAVYVSNSAPENGDLPTGTPVFGPFPQSGIPNFTPQTATLPNEIAGTTTNLIFTFKADNSTPHAYGAIDDVSLTYTIPSCTAASILSVEPNDTNATINWAAAATPPGAGYQFAITPTNTPPATGQATTGLSGSAGPLAASTTYYAWVRSDCGGGSYSTWRMKSFTTPCAAVNIPYTQDFELAVAPAIPECTVMQNEGLGSDWITDVPGESGFDTNALVYEYDTDEDASAWFFTRGLNLTAGTSYRITYSYGAASNIFPEKLGVSYGLQPNAAAMATQVANHPNIVNDDAPITNTVDFMPATTGIYYIGFHAYSVADMFNLYVDDISVTLSPTCLSPTNVLVNATASGATINWTAAVGSPAGYDFAVTPTNMPPATTTDANSTSGNVSTLAPQTQYYAWVRSDCGSGDVSEWVMVEFMTPCDAVSIPYTEDFESATEPDLPECTSNQNMGSGNDWVAYVYNDAGFDTNTLVYEYDTDEAADTWFFTRGVNLTSGTAYSLSYNYGSGGFDEKMNVYYGTSPAASAMNTQLADHPLISNDTAPINNIVNFTPSATGVYYFGFHAYSDADMFTILVDDIVVDAAAGVNQFGMAGFSYHPNPVKDKLNLKYTSDITSVAVYDLLGQKVMEKEINAAEAVLDMQPLADGAYIVNVAAGSSVATIKIIKRQ